VQRRLARGPAAIVLRRLGQVPVVERRDRLDPAREQALGEVAVEAQAAAFTGAWPVGITRGQAIENR
jgi:hypothetical protein